MATRRGPDYSVRWAVQGLMNTIPWANIFWAQLTVSGTPTQADLDAWLTAASNAYKTRFAPHESSQVTYSQASALLFLPASLALPSLLAMTGGGTGGSSATEDQSACAVVSWQTGVYWRGGKPRTYLPLPLQGNVVNNRQLSSTEIASLLTAAGNFRTDMNALTTGAITATSFGFVSFRSGNADRVPPVFFPFTSVKIHARLGTQRRRLGKWAP
jgi:hypothetical protein